MANVAYGSAYACKTMAEVARSASTPTITPDGRYIVVKGRLWRATNPSLSKARLAALTKELMAARRAVAKALKARDSQGQR